VGEGGVGARVSVHPIFLRENELTGSSSVPHKSYVYGGQTGTTVCTVAFKKTPTSRTNGTAVEGSQTEDENPLYICIDVSYLGPEHKLS
jgi:hypothetical protein